MCGRNFPLTKLTFLIKTIKYLTGYGEVDDVSTELGAADAEIDADTKRFNFWTHQIHIFFVQKFFPAAQNFLTLKEAVIQQLATRAAQELASPSVEVIIEESTGMMPPLESVAEEDESAAHGSMDNLQPIASAVTVQS